MSNPPKLNQGNAENKSPDCAFLTLHPALESQGWQRKLPDVIALKLTLSLNTQEEQLPGGKIRFGITQGTLRLQLTNCKSPYERRFFKRPLQPRLQIEKQTRASRVRKRTNSSSIKPNEAEAKLGSDREERNEETQKIILDVYQIDTKGNEDYPCWEFRVKTGEPCLQGVLEQEPLAGIEVLGTPCQIEARFTTSERYLYFEGVGGIWPSDISPNKMAILEKLIFSKILYSRFNPYLSYQEIRYE
ncbi:MAG: hypothetical protein JJU32_02440 [Phormidium sp. BM_Day4_Bin.17]|nr:hypothetical protein [Phormidium sp. BM_Day4_Bin.17]UCJ10924.1 MAG: hypothetical protein JWS08_13990 [Phormidium sp. PBR-2020]